MTKQYNLNGRPGLVERRKVRQTGRYVSLLNAVQAGFDHAGGPWVLVCEDHGWIMNFNSLRMARWHMSDQKGWCGYCNGTYTRDDAEETDTEDTA